MNKVAIIFLLFPFCLQAQDCFEADHSIWLNTWSSCFESENPRSEYGQSHWILYDFGEIRTLSKTRIWNTNDPNKLSQGFRDVRIDYSLDGMHWEAWGQMQFPKAEGHFIYPGFEGPDMNGIKAQFVLLTALSNHGHSSCYGIAEIKFFLLPGFEESIVSSIPQNLDSKYSVFPNPSDDHISVFGLDDAFVEYSIINSYGQELLKGRFNRRSAPIDISMLQAGIYFFRIENSLTRFIKI